MERELYKVDASGKTLGRLASDIASHLIGKHKPSFQSHLDVGDIVEVENASQMVITGKKLDQKNYYRHSLHPGGIKETPMSKLFVESPAKVLELAVSRMLPRNKHRVERLKRLTIK